MRITLHPQLPTVVFGLCYTAEYALIKQKREGEQELLSSDGEQFETITIKRQF